jgi:predicted PurR-regulated permease PerM
MHLWQFQPVRDLLIFAGIVGVLYLGYRVSLVTIPMLLAMMLAYLFEPLVRRLTRHGVMSRPGVAIAIIVTAFFVAVVPIAVGVGTATIQGIKIAQNVAGNMNDMLAAVRFSHNTREGRAGAEKYGTVSWEPDNPEAEDATPVFVGFPGGEGPRDAEQANQAFRRLPSGLKALVIKLVDRDHPRVPLQPGDQGYQRHADINALIEGTVSWLGEHASEVGTALSEKALGSGAQAVGTTLRALRWLAHLALTLFLTAFFFFFFSTGYGKVLAFWEGLIPERRKGRIIELLQKMDRVIAGFVRGRLTICAVLIIWDTIAYWFIGVPAPLLLGPMVGALAIIPFATVLAIPVAMVLMVLQPSEWVWQQAWWWILLGPVATYVIERALDDYILTPAIQGKHTEMAVPAILFSSLAGGVLAGVYGLLIAIPVAACVRILLKEVFWPRFRAWAEGRERDFLPISAEDQHMIAPKEDV